MLGILTDRDVNGNVWYKNLSEINMPRKDETPVGAPGLTIFEKDKKPKVIEQYSGKIGGYIPHEINTQN